MSPEDAKALVFQHWDYLQRIAAKRFWQDPALAEQAVDYLLDKLSNNDWHKVREYAGKGFTAFITVVANRLFTDFARRVGTVPHVPQWINQQDENWRKAYWMLLKGTSKSETIASLAIDSAQATAIVQEICQRERLKPSYAARVSLDEEAWEDVAVDMAAPLEQLSELENEYVLNIVFHLLQTVSPTAAQVLVEKDILHAWQQRLATQVSLDNEEYLLLVLIYRDGLSVSEAGRRLQLNVNQAQGRHRRLLKRLHSAFENCGIAEELHLLLE